MKDFSESICIYIYTLNGILSNLLEFNIFPFSSTKQDQVFLTNMVVSRSPGRYRRDRRGGGGRQ